MKKTGAKRVSGYDLGLGSAVLTAPEESYASAAGALQEAEVRGMRTGPAPAGALQRGFGGNSYNEPGVGWGQDEQEYVPQRGKLRLRFRGLQRSVGGRIVLGVVAIGMLVAAAIAVAGARSYLMHNARFVLASSDDIEITGAEHLTRDQIVSVFGADLERNIFRVSLAERQADLERLPWVAHATVMRLLPDVLRVEITERTPVAFVRQGSQIGLVDASGVLLDMPADAAGDPHYSFPVLTGLSADEAASERSSKMEVYEQFLHDLDGTGKHLSDSVSEVDVADPEDVKALITSGSSDILVHFGQEDFLKRYQEFEQHLAEWKQQYPKLASADMRYEGQIVLEMQGDGGPATVGTGAAEGANLLAPTPAVTKPAVEAKPVASVKAPAAKPPTATKTVIPKPVLPVAAKPSVQKPAVVIASAAKPAIHEPDLSNAAMPRPATPQPVALNAAAPKPAVANAVAAPKVVAATKNHPAAKKVAAWRPVGKSRPGSGISATNEKVFAKLAAEHRAELAKEHKTGTIKVAKNGKPGAGRPSAKSGVTP
jgi:cell division protein FtsQ